METPNSKNSTEINKELDKLAEEIASRSSLDDGKLKEKLQKIDDSEILHYEYKGGNNRQRGNQVDGENDEELLGHNLLHLAVCFQRNTTAQHLLKNYPDLISKSCNRDYYPGFTPFDIAVAQGNVDLVRSMLKMKGDESSDLLLGTTNKSDEKHEGKYQKGKTTKVTPKQTTKKNATSVQYTKKICGKSAPGTVFMGQLPLTVAILSYINQTDDDDSVNPLEPGKIIQVFLEDYTPSSLSSPPSPSSIFRAKNYLGDTVLHSVIRFVNCFPVKEKQAVRALEKLDELIRGHLKQQDRRAMYFQRNNINQTALQLATKYAQTELFEHLLQLENVYNISQPHDALYEMERYDVTEIDEVNLKTSDHKGKEKCCIGGFRCATKSHSIAELMCSSRSLEAATKMVTHDVFGTFISRKWSKYRWFFWPFFVFHLFNVVLMNVHIVAKGHRIVSRSFGTLDFEIACKAYFLVVGLVYILQEFVRCVWVRHLFAYKAIHHNSGFRVYLLTSGICLVTDSTLNFAFSVQNNWFLVFALITSAWFLMFFIRVCPHFSLYVVLLNEALVKAVLPFVILILIQLFVFTSCMHSFFLDLEPAALANTTKLSFETYGKALLTMGKLMVGLTEVENLLDSNQDVLAVIVFSLFVLVTFLLLTNALIGVMTNRFTSTYSNKVQITYLQKLSTIIFLEGWFFGCFACLAKQVGEKNLQKYEDKTSGEKIKLGDRYVISFRRVPRSDNPSNIEHKLNRSHGLLKEIHKNVECIMENQYQKYSGAKRLHVYHYTEC